MVPQPPPVAPKSAAAKITLQTWQQSQNVDLIGNEITSSTYGNHVRCGSVDSVESNSGSSVSSSGSSGGQHCLQQTQDVEFIATRATGKTQAVSSHNPLQFVKVQSTVTKKAEHQANLAKEAKVPKSTLKETAEEWQSNLDNWKSRRRKVSEKVIQRAQEMKKIEEEEQLRQQKEKEQQRKIKTFSEIVEKRSSKRTYNLDLYIGQGDDSGVGETPEPDDQEVELDGPHMSMRSDTSEGMTSETDSLDSDLHGSDKLIKEPPKVPKKPHSWMRHDSNEIMPHRTSSPNKLLQSCLSGKDPPSDSVSSSDVEGPIDIETMSSEDDTGFFRNRQMDSGLESLGDSHRPNDATDSASDLSQDSCSGLEKISNEPEVPKRRKRPVLQKSVTLHGDDEFLDNGGDKPDENSIRLKITTRPNFDGFGFVLKGGKDHGQDAFIDSVTPGSPADMAGLKAGDVILRITGEPASSYSHASLVFSIKQALYSKELDMTVCRDDKVPDVPLIREKPPRKKGSSFAEKLAMFSGDSPLKSEPQNGDIDKPNSLVLRRRSAFEKSPAEKEEAKNRRSSCVSPEDTKTVDEDRRHSMEVGNLVDKLFNSKKPPPPVPVKPARMKSKPLPPVPSDPPEQIVDHVPETMVDKDLENDPELDGIIPVNEKVYEDCCPSGYDEFPVPENNYVETIEDTFDNDRFVEMYVRNVDQSSPQDFAELSNEDMPLADEDMNSYPVESDVDPPGIVDSNVNNVEEIVDKVQQVSLENDPQSYFDEPVCEQFDEPVEDVTYKSVLYLDSSMSRKEHTSLDDLNEINSQELCQEDGFQNGSEDVDEMNDDEATVPASDEFIYDEVPDEQDDIVDSDISNINREHFIQINMHPMALPLEKIDEDDGVSASTTTSSDTPDTETIIDNLPTNISPLPPDDTPEVSSSAAEQVDNVPAPVTEPEDLVEVSEEVPENATSEEVAEEGQHALENLIQYSERLDTTIVDEELQEELYQLEEGSDQLSPLDVIDQIEAKLMQQLERDAMDDLVDNSNCELEEEVTRQLIYLSEDSDLLDELDAPRNAVPPSEPPPPPPPEPEDSKANAFQRVNSTKRIKKELWRRRSDFLGLDSPEAISVEDLPPPPRGLEELLKSEVELEREQRLFLEKQLSLVENEYTSSLNELNAAEEEYDPSEEYTREYVMNALDADPYDVIDSELQNDEWKTEDECQIPDSDMDLQERSLESVEKDSGRNSASPQNKAKTHIQSLGAAPRAKIMDSNKWITQSDVHSPVMRQKSLEPVFQGGSYNQNFWIAQEASMRSTMEPTHVPVDRRYSMPPACGANRKPDVTVRTWGDREAEYPPVQSRPKSTVWQGGPPPIAQTCPTQAYGYADGYHRSSWNDRRHVQEEQQAYEVNHQCSCCGSALTEGSAMGIEALQLYFHIECFRCCLCRLQLGNGSCGTDVQVKNTQLYCPKCFLID